MAISQLRLQGIERVSVDRKKETNMTTTSRPVTIAQPYDAIHWTQYLSPLKVQRTPTGALNLNVDGRHVLSPLQGFGQLWQKTFSIRLKGQRLTAGEVMKTWKERFSTFWPTWDHFFVPSTGIAAGEVVLINMVIPGDLPIGLHISTGVVVHSADEQSFTLMTPQGHMFAGWITFRVHEEKGAVLAQIQVLLRASDPLYELCFRFGANSAENLFWQQTLVALAAHFGVHEPIETHIVCLDPKVQWSKFWNIWQNAAIRTLLYRMATFVSRIHKRTDS
jgi:hypothetical protein